MRFFRLVWKNVFRKKSRAFLTIASIVLVLVLIVVLTSLVDVMMATSTTGAGAARIAVQHATGLANFLPTADREKIEQIPGIMAVTPMTWFGGTYIDERPQNFFGQLSCDPRTWPIVYDDLTVPAEQLRTWQSERDSFIAGRQLIDRYKWAIGDRIQLRGTYLPVTLDLVLRGVYSGQDESNIFFHNTYLENAFPRFAGVTGIIFLRAKSAADVDRICDTINRMFENSVAPVKAMTEKQFQLQFAEMLGNVQLLFRSISAVVLFTIVLIVANTMAMSARERVTQIAVMRAIGFRRRQILGLILSESLFLSMLGGLVGVALAIPFTALLVEGMKHSPAAPFAYNIRVEPATVAIAFAWSVAIGVLAGFVPAVRSSRVSIVDGLRQVV